MALIRSMRTCVGCAGSTYDRFILGLFSLFVMLLSRFLRSSNIQGHPERLLDLLALAGR
jgi:hypothetical protein